MGVQSPEGITTTSGVLRRFNDFLKLFNDVSILTTVISGRISYYFICYSGSHDYDTLVVLCVLFNKKHS